MNIFKKILKREIERIKQESFKNQEKRIEKISDDIGGFKGIFNLKKFNSNNKKIIEEYTQENLITNLARSSLIRLIAQVPSPNDENASNAENYKITKMRFGTSTEEIHPLLYYNANELSSRKGGNSGNAFPAGVGGGQIGSQDSYFRKFLVPETEYFAENNTKKIRIYNLGWGNFPPHPKTSQRDIFIEFFSPTEQINVNNPNLPLTAREILIFDTYDTLINNKDFGILVKSTTNKNYPLKIRMHNNWRTNANSLLIGNWNMNNNSNIPSYSREGIINANNPETETEIFWDYVSSPKTWKLKIVLLNDTTFNQVNERDFHPTIRINYRVNHNNIINSIVPKVGSNNIAASTSQGKFNNNEDFYLISNRRFLDSSTTFIDDFSIIFSVIMNGPEGNGGLTSGDIFYREAFLMTQNDSIFSAIKILSQNPENHPFRKNNSVGFLISWTIQALVV